MTDHSDEAVLAEVVEPTSPEKKKPLLPLSRILLLIFVAVAGMVIFMEYRAKLAYEDTVAAIDEAMPSGEDRQANQTIPDLYKQDIDDLLVGSPTREPDSATGTEVIAWNGALKSYRVKLRYVRQGRVAEFSTQVTWADWLITWAD